MAGHRALRGITVAGNFHQQRIDRSPKLRFENHVENLAALRFDIILEQNRRCSAAVYNPDAIKPLSLPMPIKSYDLVAGGLASRRFNHHAAPQEERERQIERAPH